MEKSFCEDCAELDGIVCKKCGLAYHLVTDCPEGFTQEEVNHAASHVKVKLGARAESSKPRKLRTTPQNPEKISIIQELAEFLTEKGYKNVEITNESKLIEFNFGKNCYKLDLICKRKPKN